MPLTAEQRQALPALRAQFTNAESPFGNAMSFDRRALLPSSGIPDDITARVEIAPPLSTPFPLLDNTVLKKPERVPVFYYSLHSEDTTPSALGDTKVVFFIHGGGNLDGHPTDPRYVPTFAALLRSVAAETGGSIPCTVIAPCYRLATVPENTFPAALQDILAAYDFIINQGYKPSNIIVAGDSAGGNHSIVLTHLALHSHRPIPKGVLAISPASMQVYDNLSEHAKAQADMDLLALSMYELSATAYVGNTGFAVTDPLVSGSFISFTESWPKTLILIGTADQLIDASKELHTRLAALKRPVELIEYDELPHGWWLLPSIFPLENRDMVQKMTQFLLG